jgi:hypothetical protein
MKIIFQIDGGIGGTIINGDKNKACGNFSFIGNGADLSSPTVTVNNYAAGEFSFIGNGTSSIACADYSFIGNGAANSVALGSTFGFIGGGDSNSIFAGHTHGFIGGGQENIVIGSCSSVVGGCFNTIGNTTVSSYPANWGFIGGGSNNSIDTGLIAGTDTPYGFIGGGMDNIICAGTCYSSIIGGQNNKVNHKWATVSGYNVSSQADCAFTTNCVIACNTPLHGSPVATGTLQYWPAPAGIGFPVGSCIVLIQ